LIVDIPTVPFCR